MGAEGRKRESIDNKVKRREWREEGYEQRRIKRRMG